MAIIKCPECGHQISDKAPTCPNCGVEIAGKICKCTDCGNVYFREEKMCPACHCPNQNPTPNNPTPTPPPVPPTPGKQQPPLASKSPLQPIEGNKKKSKAPIFLSFVIALIICAVCFYFYQRANDNKEMEEYEFAFRSSDPLVLQTYLDNYKSAPAEHRDSIEAHLNAIIQGNKDWTNAVVSNSKAAIEAYLQKYPNSQHDIEAHHKIDSLDWAQAQTTNTPDALHEYLESHPDGEHSTEAQQLYDKLSAQLVSPADESMISTLFRRYFQSINANDESGLISTVSNMLSTFLGKENATRDDVVGYLHKIYKEGITNMNFRLNNDFKIDKKEVGDGQYEFSVSFSASQNVDHSDPAKNEQNNYRIKATVSPEGKISGLNMSKVVKEQQN